MTLSSPAIPTGPQPHPAMDYGVLRAEAVEHLARLAGAQWTDHNIHDPGITILEQLCYAITDLAYRADFPIADLFASAGDKAWPPSAEGILQGDPVTTEDLQAFLLAEGATALRIESLQDPAVPLFFHETDAATGRGALELVFPSDDPSARPLRLRGLRQVLVTLMPEQTLLDLAARLHSSRLLGEDLEVGALSTFKVLVTAEVDIAAVDDPDRLLQEILRRLQATIPPDVAISSRQGIRCSDLLHAILDLPDVLAVRSLSLQPFGLSAERSRPAEQWFLEIPPGTAAKILPGSPIRLLRNGIPVPLNLPSGQQAPSAPRCPLQPATRPSGRLRDLSTFRSLRRHLPVAYGVGPQGISPGATAERRAQALQLQAYLLIFDQLLSNALAQLAFVPELLSPNPPESGAPERSYASRPVLDPPLSFDGLIDRTIDRTPEQYAAWLQEAVEKKGDGLDRRRRFLAHLLSRFGEEFSGPSADLSARREFLDDIERMTGARGSGFDILGEKPLGQKPGGFEERLRRKLGLPRAFPQNSKDPPFLVIEHILLRPVPEDAAQAPDPDETAIPFLAEVPSADPWSFQVSLVMNVLAPADEKFVAQTLCAELPAHLTPYLLWFGDDSDDDPAGKHWTQILEAWKWFRTVLRAYCMARLQGGADPVTQFLFRDARDRVIELLQLGRPWPLRDIPLPERLRVALGKTATIELPFFQQDVRYELWDRERGMPVLADPHNPASSVIASPEGIITTPPFAENVTYRIRAVKEEERFTWLRGEILLTKFIEGIDTSLVPSLRDLPPVPPAGGGRPPRSAARLCDHGVDVFVDIPTSQPGIEYDLVDWADWRSEPSQQQRRSKASVRGDEGTVSLVYEKALHDLDLRVRATLPVGGPGAPGVDFLTTLLPLRVRPDPTVPMEVPTLIRAFGETGNLQVGTRNNPSQPSVTYQLWWRAIRDEDYSNTPGAGTTIDLIVDGRMIHVARPMLTTEELEAKGFQRFGASQIGNTNLLNFDLRPATGDTLWLVLATKGHRLGPLNVPTWNMGKSSILLGQAGVELVRPDPSETIDLVRLPVPDGKGWGVMGGEPGVIYALSLDGRQLGEVQMSDDLQNLPLLASQGLSRPLQVNARRIETGLECDLSRPALLARVKPPFVHPGQGAQILFTSLPGEVYALERSGRRIASPQAGNGSELSFDIVGLQTTTTFDLVIMPPTGSERRLPVILPVRAGG